MKRLRERGLLTYRWIPDGTGKLLDLGCAAGHDTYYFSQKAQYAYGLDCNTEAIAAAQKNYPGVRFLPGSSVRLPFPDHYFDVVTFIEVLEHLPPEEEFPAIKEIYRVLKPGGVMILSVPHRGWFYFLDPLDFKFKFYRFIKWLTGTKRFDWIKKDCYGGLKGHKHYRLQEVLRLIGWGFSIEKISRNSLILHPLSTWIYLLFKKLNWQNKLSNQLLEAVSDFDFKREFGPLAYNLHLLAVKKELEHDNEHPYVRD